MQRYVIRKHQSSRQPSDSNDESDENDIDFEVNPSFQTKCSRTPIGPTHLHALRKGDHVGWLRPFGLYWHHAIVYDTYNDTCKCIRVIHFKKVEEQFEITEELLNMDEEKGDFFRFDYSKETNIRNPPNIVLKRAAEEVGNTGYLVFENNCEHFATYCKTGTADSAQLHWLKNKLKQTVDAQIKVVVAETWEHVDGASNWVGATGIFVLEIVHCVHDIYQMYESKKDGNITSKDFKVSTTQRVSEGIASGGSAIGGSIAGQYIGEGIGGTIGSLIAPVSGTHIGAVAGAYCGSVIGGVIGAMVGKAMGTSFGHWLGKKLFG